MEEITPQDAKALLDSDQAILVDVREEEEVASGLAAGAKWFPTSKMDESMSEFGEFLNGLPKEKKIILYCASGMRSGQVGEFLETKGFKTANMGGFSDWDSAGFPTRTP